MSIRFTGRLALTNSGCNAHVFHGVRHSGYPLGVWKQGETRDFQYQCWYASGAGKRARVTRSSLTIEKIDFEFAGVPHALQVRWILKHADDPREVDNRVYVFAPERGAVSVR